MRGVSQRVSHQHRLLRQAGREATGAEAALPVAHLPSASTMTSWCGAQPWPARRAALDSTCSRLASSCAVGRSSASLICRGRARGGEALRCPRAVTRCAPPGTKQGGGCPRHENRGGCPRRWAAGCSGGARRREGAPRQSAAGRWRACRRRRKRAAPRGAVTARRWSHQS